MVRSEAMTWSRAELSAIPIPTSRRRLRGPSRLDLRGADRVRWLTDWFLRPLGIVCLRGEKNEIGLRQLTGFRTIEVYNSGKGWANEQDESL
jgi:hypothetical protein